MFLNTHILASKGPAKKLCIFLHGYGADGKDLMDVGRLWQMEFPQTVMLFPDAPCKRMQTPTGYSWFSLDSYEPHLLAQGVQSIAPRVAQYVREQQRVYGINFDNTVVVGFSQGTMVALDMLDAEEPVARGTIGYAGSLLRAPQTWAHHHHPQDLAVCLIHGESDSVVPSARSIEAAELLTQEGIRTQCDMIPFMDHGINPQALERGAAFLRAIWNQ